MSALLKPARDAIMREVESIERQLVEGSCRDYTEYKAKVAERKGLLKARDIMSSAVREDGDVD